MGITSSGPWCDVCGNCILPIDPKERVNFFSVKGIEKELICDNDCKKALLKAGDDWKKLPKGPLRDEFERVNKKEK